MDEKIKTWTLRFPAKENLNMEKALFDWPIVLQYDFKGKVDWFLESSSGKKSFHPSVRLTNQNPRAFVFLRQTNQIALFLLFLRLFCSRVIISRSYENGSIRPATIPAIVTGDAPVRSLLANFFHAISNSPTSLSNLTSF